VTTAGQRAWRRSVAAAGCVAVLLSGCASIPVDGPVVSGRKVAEGAKPRTRFFVRGPGRGDGPTEIVRGFLRAAVDFSQEHVVARSFLTAASSATWPVNTVVVSGIDPTSVEPTVSGSAEAAPGASGAPADGSTATVRLLVPVRARIENDGLYQVANGQAEEIRSFDLIMEGGQWRISNPPKGVLVSQRDFAANFSQVPLYFPDPQGRWLVPDERWFPNEAPPTTIVQALLDGPSPWLAPAVTTGAPPGTTLSANGVRTEGSAIRVDLTRRGFAATPNEKAMLYAQLKETLRAAGLLGVDYLTITANGVGLVIPERSQSPPLVADAAGADDLRPVAIGPDNRLVRLESTYGVEVPGVSDLEVAGASHPAVSPDGSRYAVLVGDRSRLLTQEPGRPVVEAVKGSALTAPSFDRLGWVWTTPSAPSGVVYAAQGAGLVRVSAPWLAGDRVLSLRISREGSRALVTATHGKTAFALVLGVVRDLDGTPTALGAPLQLVKDLQTVQDGAWVDGHRVVVLGTRSGQTDQRAWAVDLGGDVTSLIGANGAQSVTVGQDEYLWVDTDKGAERQVGAGLQALRDQYRWPAVAG
jgi:hypothetical protein